LTSETANLHAERPGYNYTELSDSDSVSQKF